MEKSNKSLLKVLKNKAVQKKIIKLYCKLHEESLENSNFPGWKWSILVDPAGTVEYIYSDGDKEAIWEYSYNSIIVAQILDNAEVLPEDLGDIKKAPNYKKFITGIIDDFNEFEKVDLEDADYEEKLDDYIEENSTWADYYEFDEKAYEKLEIKAWKEYSKDCAYDKIEYAIHQAINKLERQIEKA